MDKSARFEHGVMPHLGAAYNLARWLTRDDHDAEDVVQEACLRALTFFDGFRGGDPRSWLLAIVRNTCFTWLQRNRPSELVDADVYDWNEAAPRAAVCGDSENDPEILALRKADARDIDAALLGLSAVFREVVILRDIEGLSYKEIAKVVDAPVGTVMSRLSRARSELRRALAASRNAGGRKD